MSDVESADLAVPEGFLVKRAVQENRCHNCDKLLMKTTVVVFYPKEMARGPDFEVSRDVPGLDVRIMNETKCNRCKAMDRKLIVA